MPIYQRAKEAGIFNSSEVALLGPDKLRKNINPPNDVKPSRRAFGRITGPE
jgi:hypothetical protein